LLATGCTVELEHALPEADANEIYVLLTKNGVDVTKEREPGDEPRFLIRVPKTDAAQAAELLRINSLPRIVERGLGHFEKGNLVPTATEERAMWLKAIDGEVANSLVRIDGVLEARAIVMIPERDQLLEPQRRPEPTASVFIKYRAAKDGKAPVTAEEVRRFVATAVPEMKPTAVTVLMTAAAPPPVEVPEAIRLQDVLGMRMTAASAARFRIFGLVGGCLTLTLAVLAVWGALRGGSNQPFPEVPPALSPGTALRVQER